MTKWQNDKMTKWLKMNGKMVEKDTNHHIILGYWLWMTYNKKMTKYFPKDWKQDIFEPYKGLWIISFPIIQA
jgi:hypothetical protein